jgi:CRISP-associated protein Cas1
MANRDLQEIPKFADNWSFLYFEKGTLDQWQKSVAFHYTLQGGEEKYIQIPIETVALLMLGPGTTVTHEAIKRVSESRCLMAWTGEHGVRFYSAGYTGTYSSRNLLKQIQVHENPAERRRVVHDMYQKRFADPIPAEFDIEQIRGREGNRVRSTYKQLLLEFGVPWQGRNYNQDSWAWGDPMNRALSAANACLYGIVHAAILACGFSPAIGFVHTGKQLSFVYDIADLYKTEITIPIAFQTVREGEHRVEGRVRTSCREKFREKKLMKRIIPDMMEVIYGRDYAGESDDLSEGRDVAISY